MPKRLWVLGGLALLGLGPLWVSALASLLAQALGCRVDEAGVHPCLVYGRDYGGLLYTLFVLGWLSLLTLPLSLILGGAYLAWTALRRGGG